jgi:hypothetical protein
MNSQKSVFYRQKILAFSASSKKLFNLEKRNALKIEFLTICLKCEKIYFTFCVKFYIFDKKIETINLRLDSNINRTK